MLSKMVRSIYNTIISDIVANVETISAYYWTFFKTVDEVSKLKENSGNKDKAKLYFERLKLIEQRMLTGEGDVEIYSDGETSIKAIISQIRRSPIIVMGPPGVGKSETIQNLAIQELKDDEQNLNNKKTVAEKFRKEVSNIIYSHIIGKFVKENKIKFTKNGEQKIVIEATNTEIKNEIINFINYMENLELRVLTTTLSQLKQWQLAGIVVVKDIGYNLEETSIDAGEGVAYTITKNARADEMIVPNFYPSFSDIAIKRPIYWVWFLDELVNTFPENMPLINQLLVEGQIANNSLSPNLTIVSAGNPLVHSSLARELPEPILNRLSFVYIGNYTHEVRIHSIKDISISEYSLPPAEVLYANTIDEYKKFTEEWINWVDTLDKRSKVEYDFIIISENLGPNKITELIYQDHLVEPIEKIKQKQVLFTKVIEYTKEFIEELPHLLLTLPNEFKLVNPIIEAPIEGQNIDQVKEELTDEDKYFIITGKKFYSLMQKILETAFKSIAKGLNGITLISISKGKDEQGNILGVKLSEEEVENTINNVFKSFNSRVSNYKETAFAHIITALSYKNTAFLMRGSKGPFSSGRSWYIAMKRGISIVDYIEKMSKKSNKLEYYGKILDNILAILIMEVKQQDIIYFYSDKELGKVYNDFGYNIMELAGTVGSLPGVAYGLYLIARAIKEDLTGNGEGEPTGNENGQDPSNTDVQVIKQKQPTDKPYKHGVETKEGEA
ncbi:MAG: hypothetical protein RMJ67_01105 [Elusimicrobiota bacterium]|nr:hypothetical protein [Endomicrobiia bacterium]MDW8165101.1 hypothetical protein [Elusimicrobiota bacterium]